MKITGNILVLALLLSLLIGCGVAERTVRESTSSPGSSPELTESSSAQPVAARVSSSRAVQVSLEHALREWKGTPYVLGGTSSRGIDCSAFVQVIFDEYFGIDIPRNTKRQLYAGTDVRRSGLTTGDLVFFKTGRKTLHVGVVIANDEFLHVSTSQGVTTSSMDDYYWKSRYLAGRRVL